MVLELWWTTSWAVAMKCRGEQKEAWKFICDETTKKKSKFKLVRLLEDHKIKGKRKVFFVHSSLKSFFFFAWKYFSFSHFIFSQSTQKFISKLSEVKLRIQQIQKLIENWENLVALLKYQKLENSVKSACPNFKKGKFINI